MALPILPVAQLTQPYFVYDSYTEASDTALASHVGELGAAYSIGSGQVAGMTVGGTDDRMWHTTGTNYFTSAVPPSPDYVVRCLMYVASNNIATQNFGICGRMSTSANTHMGLRFSIDARLFQLFKRVAGAFTALTTYDPGAALTVGKIYDLELWMRGNLFKMFIDGVQRGSDVTDSSITTAGRVGVQGGGTGSTSTTGLHNTSLMAWPIAG